jgi:hypothetical protein
VALQVEIGAKPARQVARLPFPVRDNPGRARSATSRPFGICPELDCVRSFVPFATIDAAERRADALGIGAERVLIASGAVSEEAYVRALARHLGVSFETLDGISRAACPQSDAELLHAPVAGMLRLTRDTGKLVIAPRNRAARLLTLLGCSSPDLRRISLTTSERMQDYVDRNAGKVLAQVATDHLKHCYPAHSAAHPLMRAHPALIAGALLLLVFAIAWPVAAYAIACVVLGLIFGAWTAIRFAALAVSGVPRGEGQVIPDHELPDYTVIVPLFRESRVVRPLIAALDALDYPALGSNCTKAHFERK